MVGLLLCQLFWRKLSKRVPPAPMPLGSRQRAAVNFGSHPREGAKLSCPSNLSRYSIRWGPRTGHRVCQVQGIVWAEYSLKSSACPSCRRFPAAFKILEHQKKASCYTTPLHSNCNASDVCEKLLLNFRAREQADRSGVAAQQAGLPPSPCCASQQNLPAALKTDEKGHRTINFRLCSAVAKLGACVVCL